MKRILFINPAYTGKALDEAMEGFLNEVKGPQTERVDVASLSLAPHHLEHSYYEALVGQETLSLVKQAENNGYDAAVIGCFYDPFLDAAREIVSRMVVTAPCEACMRLAATLGHHTAVIIGRKKWIPQMRGNIIRYGMQDQASFRCLELGVLDFQANPEFTKQRMREEAALAIRENKAEVIVLGCTMEFGFFRELQREFGLPVLDACITPLKYAEYLAELRDTCGWNASKIGGWEGPLTREITEWGITEKYGLAGLF